MAETELSKNVKQYRAKNGLTLQEMAKKCGISPQTLFHIEKGYGTPNMKTTYKVNKVLGEKE